MENFEAFINLFPHIEMLDTPKIAFLEKVNEETELCIEYKAVNEAATKYIFNFRLIGINDSNNHNNAVELKLPLQFDVRHKSVVIDNEPIFIKFLAFLIKDSLKLCNTPPGIHPNFNLKVDDNQLLALVKRQFNSHME